MVSARQPTQSAGEFASHRQPIMPRAPSTSPKLGLRIEPRESNMIARYESNNRLSKAVVANGFVFLSGITAEDRSGDIEAQTKSVLKQIDGYLAQAGTSKTKLVSANIWLSTIADPAS